MGAGSGVTSMQYTAKRKKLHCVNFLYNICIPILLFVHLIAQLGMGIRYCCSNYGRNFIFLKSRRQGHDDDIMVLVVKEWSQTNSNYKVYSKAGSAA